ncbi:MAG: sugar phosphate isomerase/epimerase [Clostridia bacterium]|nr:sugar phosphate isomerase/epimerase [Clostridia bacterium]
MNKLGIFMNFWESRWDADHIKYINKAADIGFDILEFQAQALLDMSKDRMQDVSSAAEARGIELTYSLGLDPKYDISSKDEVVRLGGIDYLKRIVERVNFMGGSIISGVSYAGWEIPEGLTDDKSVFWDNSVNSMRIVLKTAEDYGVTYCVEAVNRFEGILINTAEQALRYVNEFDSNNIGVLLDTYHMNIEERSIGDAIRLVGDKLYGFHTGENNRTPPGRGHLNWDEIFSALSEVNYKGRIVSEPFVMTGGEVGRAIYTWRNLLPDISEAALDNEAKLLLQFEKSMINKYAK